MTNNRAIEEAIEDLESQERPNVSKTARDYGIPRKTLETGGKAKVSLERKPTLPFVRLLPMIKKTY